MVKPSFLTTLESRIDSNTATSSESTSLLSHPGRGPDHEIEDLTKVVSSSSREKSGSCRRGAAQQRSGVSAVLLFWVAISSCLVLLTLSYLSSRQNNGNAFLSTFPSSMATTALGHSVRETDLLQEEPWSNVLLVSGSNPDAADTKNASDTTTASSNATFSFNATTSKTNQPIIESRCTWVMDQFHKQNAGSTPAELQYRYQKQSVDFNVFYRATANIFWNDFVHGHWGEGLSQSLQQDKDAKLKDGVPLDAKSTYTWVTGDQHLSNFGAFRNRHGDIVFSVNDFDEAAIYDFQIDVLRIAVSVHNHALTNKLEPKDVKKALKKFTDTYVETIIDYIGNEDALLFELTSKTTKGLLKKFLRNVKSDGSYEKQMKHYTNLDEATGYRYFNKAPFGGDPSPKTKLVALSQEREGQIRSVFTATKYGATMMKLGWAVRQWDDDFFTVLDVAARIGSGVGSSGVDRYYVLLKGSDTLLEPINTKKEQTAVVLDVKYEPPGAVSGVLTPAEQAWYQVLFPNAAARVVEAQRKLTSYTDPYTGWVMLPDEDGVLQPFSVRQRSPWKDSPKLDKLDHPHTFNQFTEQIAVATATSHVRGSVGKKPGDFKHVIRALLGEKTKRREWGKAVTRLARAYHEQVLLDYQCFDAYVQEYYPEKEEEEAAGG